MKKIPYLILIIGFCFNSGAFATLEIKNSWVRPAQEQGNSSLYMRIINDSDTPNKLIGAESLNTRNIELHDHEEDEGVMRMTKVDFIHIPAKGEISLESGGKHIMLFNLNQALNVGETMNVKLKFENGESMDLTVPVLAK